MNSSYTFHHHTDTCIMASLPAEPG